MSRAEKLEQAKTAIENSRTALTEKTKTDQSQLKLSGFPEVIESIKTGTKFTLNITCEAEDGTVLTAVNGEEQVTGEVHSNQCVLEVYSTGTWNVSEPSGKECDINIPDNYNGIAKEPVYGVRIIEDEPNTANRLVYIDKAVGMQPIKVDQSTGSANFNGWDKTWIFDKVYPVMLKFNGEIDYKLDRTDQTKKENGSLSDIADINYQGNAMLCIEKFYTKYSMDGNNEVIEISPKKQEGFEAIGFIREDGSEADRIFLPMFMGSYDSSNRLRSLSGQTIKYEISWNDSRTAAQKNGTGYDIDFYSGDELIRNLFYILMKDCDLSKAIGTGKNSSRAKTGTLANKGAIAYDPSTKAVKFMWLEDFFSTYSSGIYRWEAGALVSSGKLFVKMKPPYSGTATSGYTQVSDYVKATGQYISRMKCSNQYGRYPIAYEGSNSTYEASQWYDSSGSSVYVSCRGYRYGVAGRAINNPVSLTDNRIGAALTYLPPA